MNRREFMRSSAALGTASLWTGMGGAKPTVSTGDRPNILLVVSEDNGPELSCYGEPCVRTPHLDRLAAEGVRFTNAYVAQAGCSPSRAAFLTGLYPHQNGQIGLATWHFQMYRDDGDNVVRRLSSEGYRTGIIGKLHVNPESAFPFHFKRFPSANFGRKNLDQYAPAAAEFMEQGSEPFFLSINYPDAHRPFHRQIDGLPETLIDPKDVKPLSYMGLDSPTLRKDTAGLYNCMARLDGLVGKLLASLEASGKADNTLVFYIGDHGADILRGKRTSYEGGVRIPMIARWPDRIGQGQIRHELVSTVDLFPTFLDAVGAKSKNSLPGRSLLSLMRGETKDWRKHLFTEFHVHSAHNYYPQRTVRDDRFKLIQNLLPGEVNPGYDFTIQKFLSFEEMEEALDKSSHEVRAAYSAMRTPPLFELYDLRNDPYEFRNLAGDPEYGEILEKLRKALMTWRRKTNDPFLDDDNVRRLKEEIEATRRDGKYAKRESPWGYVDYMAP